MAEVVAATHDADESRQVRAMRSLWQDVLVGLGSGEFGIDGIVPHLALSYQRGQVEIGVRSCHEIGVVLLYQLVLHSLRHTADDADYWSFGRLVVWSFGRLVVWSFVECFKAVIYLILRILAHRTGVEEHGISLLCGVTEFVTRHLHHAGHDL